MRTRSLMLVAALALAAGPAAAQGRAATARATSAGDADLAAPDATGAAGAALGLTVALSGSDRDTLGLLISTVTPGGPADRAGVEAGSRLAEIDGVSLRTTSGAAPSATRDEVVMRRFARVLRGARPGDDLSLRLVRAGQSRVVSVSLGGVPMPVAAPPDDADDRVKVHDVPRPAPATVAGLVEATAGTQALLRRLVAQEEAADGPMLDSLLQLQQDLGDLQRRMRALDSPRRARRAPAVESAPDDVVDDTGDERDVRDVRDAPSLGGLRLGRVSAQLAPYYGDGSEDGLLVLQADASWSPIRVGDVILSVGDLAPSAARLRAALEGTRTTRVELLRRRRAITLTLPVRD